MVHYKNQKIWYFLNLQKEFLKRINNDLTSNEIRKEEYDKVFEPEELVKMIKRKK